MKKYYLLTPGPTPVPPRVAAKASLPVLHHRTSEFGEVFKSVIDGLKWIHQTEGDILMLSTSGTGAMESAVANLLSPGEKAIVAASGSFGERWGKICQAYGVEPVMVRADWGKPIPPADIEKALKENPDAAVVFVQHTETSTGTVNDLEAIGKIVKKTNAVLAVDAVSGLAGQPLKQDAWNLDCVVAGSQKGLMCPPGMAWVGVSAKAWKKIEVSKSPRFYWDYRKIRKSVPQSETPFTPPVTLFVAMAEAIAMIRETGLEETWTRHANLANAAQEGLKAMGLKLFSSSPCNVLTAAYVPEGVDGKALIKRMRVDMGVSVAGGQEHLMGKIVRLAHMGYMDESDLVVGLSSLEKMLGILGYKAPQPGKAVRQAQEVLA